MTTPTSPIGATVAANGAAVPSSNGHAPPAANWRQDRTAAAIIRAFTLGWKITELRARLAIANNLAQEMYRTSPSGPSLEATSAAPAPAGAPATSANQPAPGDASRDKKHKTFQAAYGDAFWQTSVWRATFNEIAATHASVFGDSSIANTLYQPAGGWQAQEEMRFLFPQSAPLYANIGLVLTMFATADSTEPPTNLLNFELYDITRRALNCLSLLHVMPDPPEQLQNQLLNESILSYTGTLLEQMKGPVAARLGPDQKVNKYTAISALTQVTADLLDAWSIFLRENYYNGGLMKNDPHEQLAFGVGSDLAGLSWHLTTATTVPRLKADLGEAPPAPTTTWVSHLYDLWKGSLAKPSLAKIEHQLADLGALFDDAYYAASQKPKPALSPSGKRAFDPCLPSETLSCVSKSLRYWCKAVAWVDPETDPAVSKRRKALPWARPKTAPATSHALTRPLERALWDALVEQSAVWQALITGDQHLSIYSVETVMHKLVEDVIAQFRAQIATRIKVTLRGAWMAAARQLAPVILFLLALCIPGIVWLALTRPNFAGALNPNGLWAVVGAGPILAGLLGFRSVVGTPRGGAAAPTNVTAVTTGDSAPATSGSPLIEHLKGVMGAVDTTFLKVLESATEQIQMDLAALNHQIGISYPLVDSVIEFTGLPAINTDFDFMSKVIWSTEEREEEVEGVVRAALGPLGMLIGAQVTAAQARARAGARPGTSG